MSAVTQTPDVEATHSDAEALLAAAQQIATLRRTLECIAAHASVMAVRAAGTKGLKHGFHALAAMAEIGLRDA